jgi:hypothetical protein
MNSTSKFGTRERDADREFGIRKRKVKKISVEMVLSRTFWINTDYYPAVRQMFG